MWRLLPEFPVFLAVVFEERLEDLQCFFPVGMAGADMEQIGILEWSDLDDALKAAQGSVGVGIPAGGQIELLRDAGVQAGTGEPLFFGREFEGGVEMGLISMTEKLSYRTGMWRLRNDAMARPTSKLMNGVMMRIGQKRCSMVFGCWAWRMQYAATDLAATGDRCYD